LFLDVFVPGAGRALIGEVSMAQDSDVRDLTAHMPDMMPVLPVHGSSASVDPCRVVPQLIGSTVAAVERELLLQTLAHCDGNRTHAARVLGVSLRTMRNKLRQYSTDGAAIGPRALRL
jgi:DNA-binding NtrC family response regulator